VQQEKSAFGVRVLRSRYTCCAPCMTLAPQRRLSDPPVCYIHPVMSKPVAVFGFYFWFSVPGGREESL